MRAAKCERWISNVQCLGGILLLRGPNQDQDAAYENP